MKLWCCLLFVIIIASLASLRILGLQTNAYCRNIHTKDRQTLRFNKNERLRLSSTILRAKDSRKLLSMDGNNEEAESIVPAKNDREWMFFDVANIHVKGGDGGKGCAAMRRELRVDLGGPCGGNGGNGGDVLLECNANLNTLSGLRRRVHYKAKDGTNGQGYSRHGHHGDAVIIQAPASTIVRDQDGNYAGQLVKHGDRLLLAKGGVGGRGNEHFKTPRNNAPFFSERGELGHERWVRLELQLVADIGLIGIPNAGKSTLLAACSNARPKIANYSFTTVVPNLGVCNLFGDSDDGISQGKVIIDIPGLLEGAHVGRGLGLAFLRHIQHCKVLIHVISGESPDPVGDLEAVNNELVLFNPELQYKPQVVVLNKIDVTHVAERTSDLLRALKQACCHTRVMAISAKRGDHVKELLQRVHKLADSVPTAQHQLINEDPVDFNPALDEQFEVVRVESGSSAYFQVTGEKIEKIVSMTNWDYYEASARFQRILEAIGINEALRNAGAVPGDTVAIGDQEFEFADQRRTDWVQEYQDGLYERGKSKVFPKRDV